MLLTIALALLAGGAQQTVKPTPKTVSEQTRMGGVEVVEEVSTVCRAALDHARRGDPGWLDRKFDELGYAEDQGGRVRLFCLFYSRGVKDEAARRAGR